MSAAPGEPCERRPYQAAPRGFALLRIRRGTLPLTLVPLPEFMGRPWLQGPHPWIHGPMRWLCQGKFYGLFSLLFGAGFALQMERSGDAKAPQVRRLAAMALFGLRHGILLWYGDILFTYACLGFALLAFRRAKDRTVLIWVAVLLGLGILAFGLMGGLMALASSHPMAQAEMAKGMAAAQARQTEGLVRAVQAYGQGPYSALFMQRLRDLGTNYGAGLAMAPHFFSMFLLGVWAHRKGFLRDPEAHRPLLVRLCAIGLPLGLLFNAIYAYALRLGGPPANMGSLWGMAFYIPGAPLLTLGYLSGFLLLALGPLKTLTRLAPMGRLALTHYLSHSVIMGFLAYFYGLGLYRKVGLPWMVLIALTIWSLQALVSPVWLRTYRFGPAEWLWRKLTYRGAA